MKTPCTSNEHPLQILGSSVARPGRPGWAPPPVSKRPLGAIEHCMRGWEHHGSGCLSRIEASSSSERDTTMGSRQQGKGNASGARNNFWRYR